MNSLFRCSKLCRRPVFSGLLGRSYGQLKLILGRLDASPRQKTPEYWASCPTDQTEIMTPRSAA